MRKYSAKVISLAALTLSISLFSSACAPRKAEDVVVMESTTAAVTSTAAPKTMAPEPTTEASVAEVFEGTVAEISKHGNLELDIDGALLDEAGYKPGDMLTVTVGDMEFKVPYCTSYSDVDTGEILLRNKEGHLTLAYNMADFAAKNEISREETIPVTICMDDPGAYHDQWLIRQLDRTNERGDYETLTDPEFANFRVIDTTGMGDHVLYRSSSPINPELGRASYADAAIKSARVKTIVNLADSAETAAQYPGFAETYYSQQNVIYLNLGIDFSTPEFQAGLAEGLRFMASPESMMPYLVHCTEGKDRAGLMSALLECFMGATCEEVVEDYMTSYYWYFKVEEGSRKADLIAESNIVKTLEAAFEVEDLKTADLKKEAHDFFLSLGLTEEELVQLEKNLANKSE